MWRTITPAAQVTGPDTKPGLPGAVLKITSLTKALLNMYGWYCKAASSSQITPRVSCSARRPVAAGEAAGGEVAAARPWLAAVWPTSRKDLENTGTCRLLVLVCRRRDDRKRPGVAG
jgi:hypothetical protein